MKEISTSLHAVPGHLPAGRMGARIPELDGMRGIAIHAVILTHLQQVFFPIAAFGVGWHHRVGKLVDQIFQMGWMGVDIFFVLSGFLITGIILRGKDQPSFYRGFYLRRSARILPIFLVVFTIAVIYSPPLRWFVYSAYLFFLANWLVLTPYEVPLLGNIWSLAVEEQFYLFWPPIVRNISRIALFRVALLLAASSVLLRIALTLGHVWIFTIYKITPTRLDGLALGAALAVALQLPGPRASLRTHWVKITAVAGGVWVLGFLSMRGRYYAYNPTSLVLGSCTIEVMTCMLIFGALEGKLSSGTQAVLSSPWMRWCGRRSYGLYLIHSLIVAGVEVMLTRHHFVGLGLSLMASIAVAAISLAAAELSWRIIEFPSIRYAHRKTDTSDEDFAGPRR